MKTKFLSVLLAILTACGGSAATDDPVGETQNESGAPQSAPPANTPEKPR